MEPLKQEEIEENFDEHTENGRTSHRAISKLKRLTRVQIVFIAIVTAISFSSGIFIGIVPLHSWNQGSKDTASSLSKEDTAFKSASEGKESYLVAWIGLHPSSLDWDRKDPELNMPEFGSTAESSEQNTKTKSILDKKSELYWNAPKYDLVKELEILLKNLTDCVTIAWAYRRAVEEEAKREASSVEYWRKQAEVTKYKEDLTLAESHAGLEKAWGAASEKLLAARKACEEAKVKDAKDLVNDDLLHQILSKVKQAKKSWDDAIAAINEAKVKAEMTKFRGNT
ncbi:unnamed protein product [Darwinula stevensoni]|uniref:Uncharacterized protein n=1 Tax=Darwinula stevensoni TaxID=69355 RepID=A0A7R9A8C2_9CRUS|nr:unnamed protein product [Darwinula stevensoni]CAG0896238.1 unnamed protein product [Darwinula stevensoni]